MRLEQPELSAQEKRIKKWILPNLNADLGDFEDTNEADIDVAESILAQEYRKHGGDNIRILVKILLLTACYDILHVLPPIIYGLLLSSVASISLAIPALHTPESLAGTVIGGEQSTKKRIRYRAEESVKTNVGMVGIAIGFAVQILAVIGVIDTEVFANNILTGAVPSVVSAVFLATVVVYVLSLVWSGSD
ncbi:hypothetical protein [Halobaculum rarum]|uniref:hypothetical protein n=1 Tax=Halobaculum rarum TaxID=3075122 RepID=UPI0032AF0609